MAVHVIKRGLDLPIQGQPDPRLEPAAPPKRVAILADDAVFMKPIMAVNEGDEVQRGQLLFEDRKAAGVRFTSPAAGKVVGVHRGEKRAFQSVVVEVGPADADGAQVKLSSFKKKAPTALDEKEVRDLLAESGLWTALRARPYGRVPPVDEKPAAIFVTATDTNPLGLPVDLVYAGKEEAFAAGVAMVSRLSTGTTWVNVHEGSRITASGERVKVEAWRGPHPAGLVGTHIHLLSPVHREKIVWHLGFQDVIAIGQLGLTGKIDPSRVVALGGPGALRPRLLATRLGASLDELVAGEVKPGEHRVVSGSPIYGRAAQGEIFGYLGRYHQQVSLLAEGREREFLGWLMPGTSKFSVISTFLSAIIPGQRFAFTTNCGGSHRAMVPIGSYETVMPLDILPTFLLRSRIMGDLERAEQLGALELDEEDLALCSFVSPGKEDYAPHLRRALSTMWKEG